LLGASDALSLNSSVAVLGCNRTRFYLKFKIFESQTTGLAVE